jgi:putative transcriptional regulator
MTKKTKAKSRIFEAVHETASDLHRLGFIDKRKMRKFDALCLDPVPAYDSEKIRALRDHLQLSQ